MKKTILVALAILPFVAFAQAPGQGPGPGRGMGRGAGPGPGMGMGDPERMEKRMRLTRTLGLAEALDLDSAQALKLGEAIGKFDERRLAAHKQLHDAHQVLRDAARGERATAALVDQALQKALDARAQLQTIDREVLATVTKDLTPEKKARAALFLERFEGRFGPGGPRGKHDGRGGHGMGRGAAGRMGMGGGAGGMGMGMGGPGPGPMAGACPDCPFDDEE